MIGTSAILFTLRLRAGLLLLDLLLLRARVG